jgi:pyrimidine-nucleoside phosphorylase
VNDDLWLRRAIAAKRDGAELDDMTWQRIVAGYVAGTIDDAPMAALAMACAIRGMGRGEIATLTEAMVRSGEVLAFPDGRVVVDKHSSGGVGDSVSLIAVPLVAACGVPVAKLAGRKLGYTGGTIDKLEAIPGVRTDLEPEAFIAQVERVGCAIAAQSDRLVPADKKIYALRDRTGSAASMGLIASSIASKKIAGGAHGIVFDVKAGRGALMRTVAAATDLADVLVKLCTQFGRRASAIVTDMEEPLGFLVGTGLEAIEARDFLRGIEREPRIAESVHAVTHEMLRVAGVPEAEIAQRVMDALDSGAAYERFVRMIEAQGGSGEALERLAPHAQRARAIATREGYVDGIDAAAIGEIEHELTLVDGPFAGIRILAPIGTPVRRGDALAEVYGTAVDSQRVARAFHLAPSPTSPRRVVQAVLRDAPSVVAAKTGA